MRKIILTSTLFVLSLFVSTKTNATPTPASSGVYTDNASWLAAVPNNLESNPSFQFQTRDNALPNVLIIGGNVSMGYTSYVQSELDGVCNVYRIPTTSGTTATANNRLDTWLDEDNWDLIYFNLGMDDLKYAPNSATGTQAVSSTNYGTNLENFVTSLKSKTNAKLVFATTTLIQSGLSNRVAGDEVVYNNIATPIMDNHGVTVDDLYTWSVDNSSYLLNNNITFSLAGRQAQATHIANTITNTLTEPQLYTDSTTWYEAVPDNLESNASFNFQTRDNALPNVLIIGSNVSMGYTSYVQSELDGVCNVYRIPTTSGTTVTANNRLDTWLDGDDWDLIYFNLGMEDLKYAPNTSTGTQAVSPANYGTNLESFVTSLKSKTDAKLVFANTTLIPSGLSNRVAGDAVVYNNIAAPIMNNNGVTIDDLHTWSVDNASYLLNNNITFSLAGRAAQATHIANTITTTLNATQESLTVTNLAVAPEAQGAQGIEQLIARATVNYTGDSADLTYTYTITQGSATLTAVEDFAILDNITSESVTIEVLVENASGLSGTATTTYTPAVIDPAQLYTNSATWYDSVTPYLLNDPSFVFQQRDENLPNVLIIGNSISIGYTSYVQSGLAGECNVYRIPVNAGSTYAGLSKLDFWLANEDWDLIHFNFGLHDLKYLLNNQLDINGTQVAPPAAYTTNLQTIVDELQAKTNATLVFANTTIVAQGAAGRLTADVPVYNTIAEGIMNAENITIDDHYTLSYNNPSDLLNDGVHFNATGKQRQATQIANVIRQELGLTAPASVAKKLDIDLQVIDNQITTKAAEATVTIQAVYNTLGQVVNNNNLDSGIYFVKVVTQGKTTIVKVYNK